MKDAMRIADLIRDGENSFVEFKNEQFHSDSLAKVVVAFANMQGGTILIGIEDDGRISGVSSKSVEERIVTICRNNVMPPIIPLITSVRLSDKTVYQVVIEKGTYKPYNVKTTNKFYIRAGSVSVEPTNEELIRLFQNGQQLHFEIGPVPGTSINDVDLIKFKAYCQDFRKIEVDDDELETLLSNLQVLTQQGNITIAGMLFFGKQIERPLPQAGIDLHCFRGTTVDSDILDSKELVHDIPHLIAAAEDFVKYHSAKRSYFNSEQTRRTDQYDYEPFVIRELVANAFVHRDWSIFGQRIRLNIFHDRFELFSPGAIPNTLTLEQALSGVSYYRNPVMAQWLKDYGISEKVGRGLFKIAQFYKRTQLPAPRFITEPQSFQVILIRANPT
jgi:ATP-dependent DNA helicase RecG